MKYPDLPEPVLDTLEKMYKNVNIVTDHLNVTSIISLDPLKKAVKIAYYNMNSKKLRIPFGMYFKIGKGKYFIHYSELKAPIIYFDHCLYFHSGKTFEKISNEERFGKLPYPIHKRFYVKYKIR